MILFFNKLNKKEQIAYALVIFTMTSLLIFFINFYISSSLSESKNNINKANQLLSDVKNSVEYGSTSIDKLDQKKDVATSLISSTSQKYNVVINSIESNDQNEVLISIDAVSFSDLYSWLQNLEVNSKIYTVKASIRRNQLVKDKEETVRVRLVLVSRR
jgi:type II secretory pathway component PulM